MKTPLKAGCFLRSGGRRRLTSPQPLLGLLRQIKLRGSEVNLRSWNRITICDAVHKATGAENVRLLLLV